MTKTVGRWLPRDGREWLAKAGARLQSQSGISLVESVVAIGILGIAVTTFVTGLSTGSISVREMEQQTITQRLARTQLEYVKSYAFEPGAATYPVVSAPEGYTVSVDVTAVTGGDTSIQKITVVVQREGEDLLSVEDYKVNR
ncbi:MAG: type II secretion system protein [Dehalococcoidales bacterium]|nr:type II secretion system protein [Dehalococcoidales bacterium]